MDKTVRIWDPETGKPFGQELKGHAKWVQALAWEPYHRECLIQMRTQLPGLTFVASLAGWHRSPGERQQGRHMPDMAGQFRPHRARSERPQGIGELCQMGWHRHDLHGLP